MHERKHKLAGGLSQCRAGRRLGHHQLEPGADGDAGLAPVCTVEPECGQLPPGLSPAGHLGRLRQRQLPPSGVGGQSLRGCRCVSAPSAHSLGHRARVCRPPVEVGESKSCWPWCNVNCFALIRLVQIEIDPRWESRDVSRELDSAKVEWRN